MFYESTRNRNRKINPSEAILQGLSEEGGLFVLRNLGERKLDLNNLIDKNFSWKNYTISRTKWWICPWVIQRTNKCFQRCWIITFTTTY